GVPGIGDLADQLGGSHRQDAVAATNRRPAEALRTRSARTACAHLAALSRWWARRRALSPPHPPPLELRRRLSGAEMALLGARGRAAGAPLEPRWRAGGASLARRGRLVAGRWRQAAHTWR